MDYEIEPVEETGIEPVEDWESEEFGLEPVKFWFSREFTIFGFSFKIEIIK